MAEKDTRSPINAPQTRRLYGRSRGHKLRDAQAHLIDTFLPTISVPINEPDLDPHRLFDRAEEVWMEIGFGSGEHLLAQAMRNPAVGMIGVEPFVNGVASLLAEIKRQEVPNIRLLMGDARDVLDVLQPQSLNKAFLLFPDPWPKKRHHKRRFINPDNLNQLARALAPGAELRVATDSEAYCAWTLDHLSQHEAFEWTAETPDDWRARAPDWPGTRYEAKAKAAGRSCVYLRFRCR